MVYTETIKVKVESQEFVDITSKVEDIVRNSKIKNGLCNIFAVGATAGLMINENEPMLIEDLKKVLEKIASSKGFYHHAANAHSHIKSIIVGNSQTLPVKNGKLVLGTWQQIMVFNFDISDRKREVAVTVIGE